MTEQTDDPVRRRPAGRSPNYPGMSLGKAVDRVALVFEKENRHWASVETVAKHLGYKSPNTGPATITYAALKKFGLLDEEGSGQARRARVSELAYRVLRAPEAERRAAVKEAALLPALHKEMQKRFADGLPSEENLVWQLEQDLGFTANGAIDFVRKYRETVSFAQLDSSDTVVDDGHEDTSEPELDEEDGHDQDRRGDRGGSQRRGREGQGRSMADGVRTFAVPIIGGESVILEGAFPISETAWSQFMAVLNAMKPGLVEPIASSSQDEG